MMNNTEIFVSSAVKEKYYLYHHPSGLDIYLFPKKMTSVYAIFGTRYGSIDNTFKVARDGDFITVPDGIAHFLEHKLFANEDGSDAFEHFSAFGADANAYTSFNKTAYLFSCTENFEDSLAELLSFVTHPYFTEESVKKEIGIIAQEIKMYDDSPSDRCFYGMLEGMYEHHSIRRNICGTVESISKITPKLLYDCYHTFYNLSNMALVISGDVELDTIVKVADRALPKKSAKCDIICSDENQLEKKQAFRPTVSERMNVSKPMFCIGIKDTDIPADGEERQKKDAIMSVLNEMLFSRCSDFYDFLLQKELINPSFSYCYTISASAAYNSLAGESDEPETVLREVKKYLSDVASTGLSKKDFERAKRVMYSEYVKLFDSTDSIANTLLSFVFDGASLFRYGETLASLTFEEVEETFKTAFPDECFTLSVIYPIEKQEDL